MAFMTINYKSPTIGMNQSFTAIVPEDDSFLYDVASLDKPCNSNNIFKGFTGSCCLKKLSSSGTMAVNDDWDESIVYSHRSRRR
jgi:hypothetical protein